MRVEPGRATMAEMVRVVERSRFERRFWSWIMAIGGWLPR